MTDKLDDAALAAIKARASRGMQYGGITASDYTGPIVIVRAPDWNALLAEVERLRADAAALREALEEIAAPVVTRVTLPWTHEQAADEYWRVVDRLRGVASAALARAGGGS